jgi:hypothetical protein
MRCSRMDYSIRNGSHTVLETSRKTDFFIYRTPTFCAHGRAKCKRADVSFLSSNLQNL